ncbi:hypothetical protein BX666DRAFT_2025554 [Dichotomocladium elegans]|nr:hypothetical protein BX666DRAFT_2025554 [Dichotomocladium elegans]
MFLSRRVENILNQSRDGKSPITMRALIDANKAGAMIGRGGSINKQMQDMFKVRVLLHTNVDPIGRLTSIFGYPAQVAQVWREVLLRMYGIKQFELSNGKELGLDFLVPKRLADWLIENKELARIHRTSKANIRLKRCPLPRTTEQILQITVCNLHPDCLNYFETAVHMLGQCIQDHPNLALSPSNVYYVPSGRRLPFRGNGGGFGSSSSSSSTAAESHLLDNLAKEDEQWQEQLLAE